MKTRTVIEGVHNGSMAIILETDYPNLQVILALDL